MLYNKSMKSLFLIVKYLYKTRYYKFIYNIKLKN